MEEEKLLSIKDFYNNGLLFEINRTIMHPAGLQLEIFQTTKRFSYFDTSKKLIETSLSLKDILNKFEILKREKRTTFRQKELDKTLIQAFEGLVKLEPKCGFEIQSGKVRILITREDDDHDEECGIKISSKIKMAKPSEEFAYNDTEKELQLNWFKEFKNKTQIRYLQRMAKLGFIRQGENEEVIEDGAI